MNEAQIRDALQAAYPMGRRGIDIPEDIHKTILDTARGITQPVWGRDPTPQQMQWLHDMGAHTPDAVHDAFDALPHPNAPTLTVGEYGTWSDALQHWDQNAGARKGG